MNINKPLKQALLLAVIGFCPLSIPAKGHIPQTEAVLNQAVAASAAREKHTAKDFLAVQTTWNRCDVYQSRRSARIGGSRGKVQVDYNCKDVSTRCNAVLSDGKAYISQSCYYADKKEDQNLYFKSSQLTYTNGKTVSLLPSQMSKNSGYVIFSLK